MRNESLVLTKKTNNQLLKGMDSILTSYLTKKTMGEICMIHESTNNTRSFIATDLIINAVGEGDIALLNSIVRRIDGAVPKAENKDKYANLLGNAIDYIMDQPLDERQKINFEKDLGIVAMAKAVCRVATQVAGTNPTKRKDRQLAADILLSRTGGVLTEPVKEDSQKVYVDPEWALDN